MSSFRLFFISLLFKCKCFLGFYFLELRSLVSPILLWEVSPIPIFNYTYLRINFKSLIQIQILLLNPLFILFPIAQDHLDDPRNILFNMSNSSSLIPTAAPHWFSFWNLFCNKMIHGAASQLPTTDSWTLFLTLDFPFSAINTDILLCLWNLLTSLYSQWHFTTCSCYRFFHILR